MDINEGPSYEELQKIFKQYFHLPNLGSDCSDKLALISLVCNLTFTLKEKKPDITHWSILYQLNKKGNCGVPEDWLKGLAVICSEFDYGCSIFPDFGLSPKEMPNKIIELLKRWLPF